MSNSTQLLIALVVNLLSFNLYYYYHNHKIEWEGLSILLVPYCTSNVFSHTSASPVFLVYS